MSTDLLSLWKAVISDEFMAPGKEVELSKQLLRFKKYYYSEALVQVEKYQEWAKETLIPLVDYLEEYLKEHPATDMDLNYEMRQGACVFFLNLLFGCPTEEMFDVECFFRNVVLAPSEAFEDTETEK